MYYISRSLLAKVSWSVVHYYLPIYVTTGYLAGYISMSLVGFRPRFQCLVSPLLQLPCQKDQPGYRSFDSQLPCQKDQPGYRCFDSQLPASSFTCRVMCSQARMYEINYIDQQSQDKNRCGQLAVGIRHSPLQSTANTFFIISENADHIDCLYGERSCAKTWVL